MKTLKTLKHIVLLVGMILMGLVSMGQTITDYPYFCGFEENDNLSEWQFWYTDEANLSYFGIGSYTAFDGSQSLQFSSYNSASSYQQYVISPQINTQYDINLKFYYRAYSYGTETFKVGYSTQTNSFSDFIFGDEISVSSTDWIEFNEIFSSNTKYICILYYSNYQYCLWVDSFNLTQIIIPREQCQVGDNWGDATNTFLPSYSYYNYSLTQQIYTPEEIGEADEIGFIHFYNAGNTESRKIDIYFKHTDKNAFDNNTDWITVSEGDKVFSSPEEISFTSGEWTVIRLDNIFEYDGISNLAVIIDDNTGSWTPSPHMSCKVYDAPNQAIYQYSDYNDYSPINPPTEYSSYDYYSRVSVKNQIKLCNPEGWTLPIHLLEFSAEPRYDHQTSVHVLNLLTIRTGYEYNNCEFIVYRSEDAINWDYDNPVCDWDFGKDSAIYNEALDTVLNYFTIEHPNGQTYYPIDYEPYEVTYYKLIQRDCDNTSTEYTSEIIVCIANQQKNLIEPYVICDNRPQVVGGSEVCEVFVYNVLGQTIEQFLLQPYQQREVLADIQGMYLITFVYKYNGETCKKTEKVVCW